MPLDEIRQIAQRRIDDVDATALVWEVTRLQSLVAQAGNLLQLDPDSAEATNLRRELLERLADEPVVSWKA